MDYLDTPTEALAAAIYSACLRDLSDIHYKDRDWAAHRAMLNAMEREEREAFYARELAGAVEGAFIEKTRRPTVSDVHVIAMFPQTWGSTALGYGGIGGAAMTTAYTIAVECSRTREIAVYFGNHGRLAYIVPNEDSTGLKSFMEDLRANHLAGCYDKADERYGAIRVKSAAGDPK